MKSKFYNKKPVVGVFIPVEHLAMVDTTTDKLKLLVKEMGLRGLNKVYVNLITRLATLPPAVRLSVNIKIITDVLANRDITNVLADGLVKTEREALKAIDGSGMSTELRRTAHSLLDMDTRMRLVTGLHKLFRNKRTRRAQVLNQEG